MFKNTWGVRLGTHDVQLVGMLEHVRQGDWHGMHTLLTGTFVEEHDETQSKPSKLRVLHEVHLVAKSIHVAQSPLQGLAYPLSL